jgi:hypothetical protein
MTDLYPIAHVFVGGFLALLACWWLVVRPYLAAAALAADRRANDAKRKQIELQDAFDAAVTALPRAKYDWREAKEALEIAATEHTGSPISYIAIGEEEMNPAVDPLWWAERRAFEHWKKAFRTVQETYFALHGAVLHEYRDREGRYGGDEEAYRFFYDTDEALAETARNHAKKHELDKEWAKSKWQKRIDALFAERDAR